MGDSGDGCQGGLCEFLVGGLSFALLAMSLNGERSIGWGCFGGFPWCVENGDLLAQLELKGQEIDALRKDLSVANQEIARLEKENQDYNYQKSKSKNKNSKIQYYLKKK